MGAVMMLWSIAPRFLTCHWSVLRHDSKMINLCSLMRCFG